MADVTPVVTNLNQGTKVFWETLTATNAAGAKVSVDGDRISVQVTGTPDSATLVIQGSNDGTNWATLENENGDSLSLAAAGLVTVQARTIWIRPSTSGGGASQDLDVTLFATMR